MKTKRVFRSIALFMMVATMSVMTAEAQTKGDKAVGGNLSFGSGDSYSNLGIGAKFLYNVADPIRLEGAFTYFLEKDNISQWDLSVYGHYLFNVADKVTLYPIAGLGLYNVKASYMGISASESEFGFTIGGGLDYQLTDKLVLTADLKYKMIKDMDRMIISVGIAYKF